MANDQWKESYSSNSHQEKKKKKKYKEIPWQSIG